MEIKVPSGKYVLAVSGGVDSMVLLDLLSNLPGVEIIAAHFDHGIRPDSAEDEKFVEQAANNYGLVYETHRANLSPDSSEEKARDARYEFLEKVKAKYKTDAVITAHHQDDLIETALINILRGTGPKGLIAMASNPDILRPLLGVTKKEILGYAKTKSLRWHEDPTNASPDYLRNYIRQNVIPKLNTRQKAELIKNIEDVLKLDKETSALVETISGLLEKDKKIDRQLFAGLPSEAANELVAFWLRRAGFRQFDRKTVNKVSVLIKTALPHTRHHISKAVTMAVDKYSAWFETNT